MPVRPGRPAALAAALALAAVAPAAQAAPPVALPAGGAGTALALDGSTAVVGGIRPSGAGCSPVWRVDLGDGSVRPAVSAAGCRGAGEQVRAIALRGGQLAWWDSRLLEQSEGDVFRARLGGARHRIAGPLTGFRNTGPWFSFATDAQGIVLGRGTQAFAPDGCTPGVDDPCDARTETLALRRVGGSALGSPSEVPARLAGIRAGVAVVVGRDGVVASLPLAAGGSFVYPGAPALEAAAVTGGVAAYRRSVGGIEYEHGDGSIERMFRTPAPVRRVDEGRALVGDGDRIAWSTGREVRVANVRTGAVTVVARAARGTRLGVVALSGRRVAWLVERRVDGVFVGRAVGSRVV